MPDLLENLHIQAVEPLPAPAELKRALPVSQKVREIVLRTRSALRDILHGRDPTRRVAIVGPCSIHDRDAALDYAARLKRLADTTGDHLLVLMRSYFEKPRTTVGWKGLINDPQLDGSCDVAGGLRLARELLLEINEIGLPCSTELLDPFTPQYLADLVSWAAIGARTSESQTHRAMASGLSMPTGFKNGTEGNLQVALDAMVSAAHPHSFLGLDEDGGVALVKTAGNPDRHVVLRGGAARANHHADDVADAVARVRACAVPRGVLIDCSHDNSRKDHTRQAAVCREVGAQIRAGQQGILGVMLESHIAPGQQDWQARPRAYGVSITDACIGWDETEALLEELAASVAEGAGRLQRAADPPPPPA